MTLRAILCILSGAALAACAQAAVDAPAVTAGDTHQSHAHSKTEAGVPRTVKPGAPVELVADPAKSVSVGMPIDLSLRLRGDRLRDGESYRVSIEPSEGLSLGGQRGVSETGAPMLTLDGQALGGASLDHAWLQSVTPSREGDHRLNIRVEVVDATGRIASARAFAVPVSTKGAAAPQPDVVATRDSTGRAVVALPAED